MSEPKTIYQTISTKYTVPETESNGPVYCYDLEDDDWLGPGYYFWDTHIQLAEQWGIHQYYRKKKSEFFICKSECTLDSKCYDLHESGNRRIEFEQYARNASKLLNRKLNELLVRDIVMFLRSKIEFSSKYDSIRILGECSFKSLIKGVNIRYFDINNKSAKYIKYPAVQFCFFENNVQQLTGYQVVHKSSNFSQWA